MDLDQEITCTKCHFKIPHKATICGHCRSIVKHGPDFSFAFIGIPGATGAAGWLINHRYHPNVPVKAQLEVGSVLAAIFVALYLKASANNVRCISPRQNSRN